MLSRTIVPVAVLTITSGAHAQDIGRTVIRSDYGSLTVGAILQGLFAARFDGDADYDSIEDVHANDHFDFEVQHARIFLRGNLLGPNLIWAFCGDATLPEFLLDAKIGFIVPEGEDISTRVTVGRFLPPFTLILPRNVSRLDAVRYPLYLFAAQDPGGVRQPFASADTAGRQVGLLVTQRLTDAATIDAGVFNGYQHTETPGSWADENDAKDVMFRLAARPTEGLLFAADYWLGFPMSLDAAGHPFAAGDDETYENDIAHMFVFETEITIVENLKIEGEFAYAHHTTRTLDAGGARGEATTQAVGAWGHLGYLLKGLLDGRGDLELFARYDYFDPDIDAGGNAAMRITLGPQFFLEGLHSQLRLNYAFGL